MLLWQNADLARTVNRLGGELRESECEVGGSMFQDLRLLVLCAHDVCVLARVSQTKAITAKYMKLKSKLALQQSEVRPVEAHSTHKPLSTAQRAYQLPTDSILCLHSLSTCSYNR